MKQQKSIVILLIVLILIITIYFVFPNNGEITKVCINNSCFHVEVANSESEREIGLMNRDFLENNSGMLFVFPENGIHSFWMKDTKIPLDMIWISNAGKVLYVQKNAEPCLDYVIKSCPVYQPNFPSRYILEINAGVSDEEGIKVGDLVEID